MSYCLDINSPLVRSESDYFRLIDALCCCFTRPIIFKWSTTQVCLASRVTKSASKAQDGLKINTGYFVSVRGDSSGLKNKKWRS